MHYFLKFFLLLSVFSLAHEGIQPSFFIVNVSKHCEVLMLHKKPERKSPSIPTSLTIGDRVENLGCLREISQKELEAMDETKRNYMSWKYPVWCKVQSGKKEGWVEKQYLKAALKDKK